jgi:hypothetical protein
MYAVKVSGPHHWVGNTRAVTKIMKAQRPAEMPLEQPIKFETVNNLETPK